MESDSSNSDNSIGQILMRYRKKVLEDRLALSASQNINLPTSSGCTSDSLNLKIGSPFQENNNSPQQRRTRSSRNKKLKSNGSPRNKSHSAGKRNKDPNNKTRDYLKMGTEELNSIAKRVRVLHDTGILLSDDERNVIPCKNRYKKKNKSDSKRELNEQVCGTKFGQGRIGTTRNDFGALPKCACCNVPGNHNPITCFDIMEGMSEEMHNEYRKREERLLQIQERDLLKHPELEDNVTPAPPPELQQDKREWIQKFIDTMSVDRVDYDKPKQLNIVEGIAHKRASDVHFNAEEQLTEFLDAKTILERVDFGKEQEKLKQLKLEAQLREVNATSTPKAGLNFPITIQESPVSPEQRSVIRVMPSTSSAATPIYLSDSINNDFVSETPNIFTSTRIGSILDDCDSGVTPLDRSNVTIRTPRSKLIEVNSGSKPKVPINKPTDIMNFVETLVAGEEESINQEARERCDRLLQVSEQTRNILHDALDEVMIDTSPDRFDHVLDNSVEIIEPFPNIGNNSVQVIESDEDVITIDILDTPSTSRRPRRSTRCKRPLQDATLGVRNKRSKRNHNTPLPPILETVPASTCTSPTPLVPQDPSTRGIRECPICLESTLNKELSSTTCGHVFCTVCIKKAIKSKKVCPTCRSGLNLKKIHPIFI